MACLLHSATVAAEWTFLAYSFRSPSLIRYRVLLLRQADGWTDRGGGRSLERDDNRDQTDPEKFSNLSDVDLNSNHDGGMIAPLFGFI